MDDLNFDSDFQPKNWFTRIPVPLRAALVFAIPFILVDIWNYFSAGVAQVLSWPVMVLIYAGCGALAGKFATDSGSSGKMGVTGASAGMLLWLISTVVNVIISLVAGTASLGGTLLLGVPYLCICAPIQLIAGGLAGALGAWLYNKFSGRSSFSDLEL